MRLSHALECNALHAPFSCSFVAALWASLWKTLLTSSVRNIKDLPHGHIDSSPYSSLAQRWRTQWCSTAWTSGLPPCSLRLMMWHLPCICHLCFLHNSPMVFWLAGQMENGALWTLNEVQRFTEKAINRWQVNGLIELLMDIGPACL